MKNFHWAQFENNFMQNVKIVTTVYIFQPFIFLPKKNVTPCEAISMSANWGD